MRDFETFDCVFPSLVLILGGLIGVVEVKKSQKGNILQTNPKKERDTETQTGRGTYIHKQNNDFS